MQDTVIVSFAANREYEFRIPEGDSNRLKVEDAERWLSQQFEEMRCTPKSMVGKILAIDRVLAVARAAGEQRFADRGAWAEQYARAVSASLARKVVHVDVGEDTVR